MRILTPATQTESLKKHINTQSLNWDFLVWSKKEIVPCVTREIQGIKVNPGVSTNRVVYHLESKTSILKYNRFGFNLGDVKWSPETHKLRFLKFSEETRLVLQPAEIMYLNRNTNQGEVAVFPGKFYEILVKADEVITFTYNSEG